MVDGDIVFFHHLLLDRSFLPDYQPAVCEFSVCVYKSPDFDAAESFFLRSSFDSQRKFGEVSSAFLVLILEL